jgi:hypothetical protein
MERSDMESSHGERERGGSMSFAYGGGAEPQYYVSMTGSSMMNFVPFGTLSST